MLITLAAKVTGLTYHIQRVSRIVSPGQPFAAARQQVRIAFARATRETVVEKFEEYRGYLEESCRGFELLRRDHGGEGAGGIALGEIDGIDRVIDELAKIHELIGEEIARFPLYVT